MVRWLGFSQVRGFSMKTHFCLLVLALAISGCSPPNEQTLGSSEQVSTVEGLSAETPAPEGPEVVQITVDSTCSDCTISAEHLATLGDVEDPTSPFGVTWVARDTAGFFYVAPIFLSGEIAVYGSDGRFVETIGRSGEGPGEFGQIRSLMITGGDTLHVFSDGRHTAMSASTREVFSVGPLPLHGRNFHVFGNGYILQDQTVVEPGAAAMPVHLYDPEGQRVRSFGLSPSEQQGQPTVGDQRAVSFSWNGGIWIHPYGQYRLELWDTAGVHLKTYVRDAPWITPWRETLSGQPYQAKPFARVVGVHQDREGKLWVYGRVPDKNWQPSRPSGFFEDVYDTVMEVVDPVSGKLLAFERFEQDDQLLWGFFADDLAYAVREGEFGLTVIDIWRLRLVREGMAR
jgi:hypothetical protein